MNVAGVDRPAVHLGYSCEIRMQPHKHDLGKRYVFQLQGIHFAISASSSSRHQARPEFGSGGTGITVLGNRGLNVADDTKASGKLLGRHCR